MSGGRHVEDMIEECENNDDRGELGPRDVDLKPFRKACVTLYKELKALGPNKDDEETDDARKDLMNSIRGILNDTDCDQNMIGHY
jgi:hypothetical protein